MSGGGKEVVLNGTCQILCSTNHNDFLSDNARKLLNNPSSLSETLLRQRAHEHFNITMAMFNENFGLCLPVRDIHEEEETPASLDRKKSQDYQSMV